MDNLDPSQVAPQSNVVNVIDENGQLVGLPADQAQQALQDPYSGFSPASHEQVQNFADEQKYTTPGQKVIAGLEGLGKNTFGLATAAEKALGVPEKDIQGRAEHNAYTELGGQALPWLVSPELGVAANAIGEGAASAIGGEGLLAKVGSSAAENAVVAATMQLQDESSKAIVDPNWSADTAVTNIGLAGLYGGALGTGIGATSALWKATMGGKTGALLQAIQDRANGGLGSVPDAVDQALATSGIDVAPEVRASMSADPWVKNLASTLEQSDSTQAGREFQASMQGMRTKASDAVVDALGKTPEDVSNIKNVSDFEAGQSLQNNLKGELKNLSEPVSEAYDRIQDQYRQIPLPNEVRALMQDRIAQAIQENGWKLLPDSEELAFANQASTALNNVESLEDLRKLQSNLGARAVKDQLWKAKSAVDQVLSSGRDAMLDTVLQDQGPEARAAFQQAKNSYRSLMQLQDELNARLKLGNTSGPRDFLVKLGDQSPEVTLNRLGRANDAGLLQVLGEHFPQTAQAIREFHINNILDKAAETSESGFKLNPGKALKSIQNLSPELRSFALPAQAESRMQAVQTLLKSAEDSSHNWSNTARTWDKIAQFLPNSVVAMAGFLTGHPAAALILSPFTKFLGRDIPDAIKLSLLKFLGSSAPLDSGAFKAMAEFVDSSMKGQNLVTKTVKNIFKTGALLSPQIEIDQKQRDKLDQQVAQIQKNPNALFNVGGQTGHYLPEHGTALAQLAQRNFNYLAGLKPTSSKASPLDSEPAVSQPAKAAYQNALTIAEQPLSVLAHVKDGTLTPQVIQHLQAMYPTLYSKLRSEVSQQMIEAIHNGETIPYRFRQSLSLFLGQPLDSTLTPQGIISAQSTFAPTGTPQVPGPQGQKGHKVALNAFKKISSLDETPLQSRISAKNA